MCVQSVEFLYKELWSHDRRVSIKMERELSRVRKAEGDNPINEELGMGNSEFTVKGVVAAPWIEVREAAQARATAHLLGKQEQTFGV